MHFTCLLKILVEITFHIPIQWKISWYCINLHQTFPFIRKIFSPSYPLIVISMSSMFCILHCIVLYSEFRSSEIRAGNRILWNGNVEQNLQYDRRTVYYLKLIIRIHTFLTLFTILATELPTLCTESLDWLIQWPPWYFQPPWRSSCTVK